MRHDAHHDVLHVKLLQCAKLAQNAMARDAYVLLLLVLLAHLTAHASTAATEQHAKQELLKDCYSREASWERGTFDGFLHGELARLHLHRTWWSTKSAPGQQLPYQLGLFTASTTSRLDTLLAMCRSWAGVLSVAVYVPLPHSSTDSQLSPEAEKLLKDAVTSVGQLFTRMEAEASACVIRIQLVFEPIADQMLFRLLPINSLRNTALLGLDTPLVAMVDVDLLPSAQLSSLLTTNTAELQRISELCQNKKMVVMVAFETDKSLSIADGQILVSDLAARGNKAEVVASVQAGKIIPFALTTYMPGHNATDYPQWYTAQQDYSVSYQINYEPWYIMERKTFQLYDGRFRGYGWNKVTQVANQHAAGYEFVVHPYLFLVHRPHLKSDAQGLYHTAASTASSDPQSSSSQHQVPPAKLVHRRVAALRHLVMKQMFKGIYKNVNGSSVSTCLQTLPWWHGIVT